MAGVQDMRREVVLKLNEMIDTASNGIKWVIEDRRLSSTEEPMIDIVVGLLNHNIRELNEIMEEEE